MRKFQKAAVVVAMLGSIGFIGSGTAFAGDDGPGIDVTQTASCVQHDTSVNILSNVSALNGLLSGLIGNEGDPGASDQNIGSKCAASNDAF
ncbi:hypothetical protein [Streptomyces sp. NBC_00887]|uniref:hypothetical protein n=1 Tax=Streptomyces sp. NBC_00887 TaxID=2975859 RepID=UPI0038635B1F|nr:hypothetical protein OG844_16840 [Streptomyces sp. NBC_00887]